MHQSCQLLQLVQRRTCKLQHAIDQLVNCTAVSPADVRIDMHTVAFCFLIVTEQDDQSDKNFAVLIVLAEHNRIQGPLIKSVTLYARLS